MRWLGLFGGDNSEPVLDLQPRPARTAARIMAGLIVLANGIPSLLAAFNLIEWTPEQYGAVNGFLGVVQLSVALFLGHQVENQVTPVGSPRDDALVPLVPIADDFADD